MRLGALVDGLTRTEARDELSLYHIIHSKMTAMRKPEGRSSPGPDRAGNLIADFPLSRTVRNNFPCF